MSPLVFYSVIPKCDSPLIFAYFIIIKLYNPQKANFTRFILFASDKIPLYQGSEPSEISLLSHVYIIFFSLFLCFFRRANCGFCTI